MAKPSTPTAKASLAIKNMAAAPVVFFDSVPTFGHLAGIIQVELAGGVLVPRTDDTVAVEIMSTGHLRGSVPAMVQLRDAIDKALQMAAQPAIKLAS